jgi:hypothetical protein
VAVTTATETTAMMASFILSRTLRMRERSVEEGLVVENTESQDRESWRRRRRPGTFERLHCATRRNTEQIAI